MKMTECTIFRQCLVKVEIEMLGGSPMFGLAILRPSTARTSRGPTVRNAKSDSSRPFLSTTGATNATNATNSLGIKNFHRYVCLSVCRALSSCNVSNLFSHITRETVAEGFGCRNENTYILRGSA
jgi:hypothetical protein